MRSMHIIGSRDVAGAERFFLRLTRTLAAQGDQVLAVLRRDSALHGRLGEGVTEEAVRMRSIFDPFARARIVSLVKGFGAQIVQSYMGRATRLTHLHARQGGAVHVARVGRYHDLKGFRHAHAWIASTDGIRQYLLDGGLPGERVFMVRNMVDPPPPRDAAALAALREQLSLEPDARVLMCVGRLYLERGVDVFLDALGRMPERVGGAPLRAVIVGDGPQRAPLQEQAQALGIAQRMRWVVGPALPDPYLGLAHVFVYPSRQAPTGTAILEAWNHDVPVVAADAAGPRELIENGRTGILVPQDDADALAGALVAHLEAGEEARAALVAAARQRLVKDHDAKVVAQAYRGIYTQLLA